MKSRFPEGARLHARRWLLEQLEAGRWQSGQTLDASDMAGQMSLSPSPVREALARLHGEGIISARHREGYSTVRLNPDELAMEYRVIGALTAELVGHLDAPGRSSAFKGRPAHDRESMILSEIARAAGSPSAGAFLRARMTALIPYRRVEADLLGANGPELQNLETLLVGGMTAALRQALRQYYGRRARSAVAIYRAVERRSESFEKELE